MNFDWPMDETLGGLKHPQEQRLASDLPAAKGRPLPWEDHVDYGKRAAGGSYTGRVVIYADKVHTDPWLLLVSPGLAGRSWGQVVALYTKRFTCEESYKDQKNQPNDGSHMNSVKLGTAERWERMGFIFAWADHSLNVGDGWWNIGERTGLACQPLRKTHLCVMALRFLGPPIPCFRRARSGPASCRSARG